VSQISIPFLIVLCLLLGILAMGLVGAVATFAVSILPVASITQVIDALAINVGVVVTHV